MTPYDPALLPLDLNYSPLVGQVGRANAALARYDGLLLGVRELLDAAEGGDGIF
jgi:hypothetical protein